MAGGYADVINDITGKHPNKITITATVNHSYYQQSY